jgi:GntR family transcriptional repressor for pyruvate dehydrogenase complex
MVRLAELIDQGSLQPGDRLPSERVLADRMGVSRATLREALRVMQLQGFIVSRRGAGNFIAGGRSEDLALALQRFALHDIFELRMLVEPSIAAVAAERATLEDISRLESILNRQEQQLARAKSVADTDTAFHSALAESTHNRALQQVGATLMQVIAPSRNGSLQTQERARLSLISHQRILGAIKSGSTSEARRAMEEHIRSIDAEVFGLRHIDLFTSLPGAQVSQEV